MLISFSVGNFRSFGEEQSLNMVASNRLADHPSHLVSIGKTGKFAVRTAVIYGANAAGKSNLIRAMATAQRLIHGHRGSGIVPFRFDERIAAEPTTFEFRFLVRDHVFVYGMDIATPTIKEEWLAVVTGNDENDVIFKRNSAGEVELGDHIDRMFTDDPVFKRTLKLAKPLPLRRHQLFLSRLCTLPPDAQGDTLREVIRWLTEDLVVLEPGHSSCEVLQRLTADREFQAFAEEFLRIVDTKIDGLGFQEKKRELYDHERDWLPDFPGDTTRREPFLIPPYGCTSDTVLSVNPDDPTHVIERRLEAKHHIEGQFHQLAFSDESDGTQQLLHYVPILFTRKSENKVVVIDELDRSLHPLLCREFIRFFCDACPGARRQLIVTTHESQLLDQELLRRDEYWLVERDNRQQSWLIPLTDYNIRNDLQIEKGYLQGRFGAIPVFGATDQLRKLMDCDEQEQLNAAKEATLKP